MSDSTFVLILAAYAVSVTALWAAVAGHGRGRLRRTALPYRKSQPITGTSQMRGVPKPCAEAGCGKLLPSGAPAFCADHGGADKRVRTGRKRSTSGWAKLREQAIARDRRCRRCGATQYLEVHHRHALAEGGTNELRNLVTLCGACHRELHARRASDPHRTAGGRGGNQAIRENRIARGDRSPSGAIEAFRKNDGSDA